MGGGHGRDADKKNRGAKSTRHQSARVVNTNPQRQQGHGFCEAPRWPFFKRRSFFAGDVTDAYNLSWSHVEPSA